MAVEMEAGPVPKGNWVARNLRLQNEESKELFPQTPAEIKPTKFHSMYKKDYTQYPTEVFLEGLAPKGQQPDRESIRDVLFGQSPTAVRSPRSPSKDPLPAPDKAFLLSPRTDDQAFANWKIPKRLSEETEAAKIGDHIKLAVPEKVETPALLRQSTLPAIPTKDTGRVFTPTKRVSAAKVRQLQSPAKGFRRAKTTLDQPSPTPLVKKEAGNRVASRVAQWQEKLPDVDPRLLHKVMRLQDNQQQQGAAGGAGQVLRGTLLPDARRTVERWLETASEPERQVALQFFSSLGGGKLLGGGAGGMAQNTRLKEVVAALQNPGNRYVAEGGLSPRGGAFQREGSEVVEGPRRLKYFNTLDEETRRNRWMHTTWHHLPNYRLNNTVTNWGSHYVRPHQALHRHFVIHPEWPPQ